MRMTGDCEHMTLSEFNESLQTKPRGTTFVYCVGSMAFTIHYHLNSESLLEVAKAARLAARAGLVELTQKRVEANVFEYRATIRITGSPAIERTNEQPAH